MDLENKEAKRLELQSALDAARSSVDRNRLGQFATPTILARDILRCGLELLEPLESVKFFDPALGTGSFFSALLQEVNGRLVEGAQGIELDPHYGKPAEEFWENESLEIVHADFTSVEPLELEERPNLLICNPPYVRHHHLNSKEKKRIGARVQEAAGVKLSGLAGLYCYFIGLAHEWMAPKGIAGWLIPSEFMDVNYGAAIRDYLLNKVTLVRVHRFDPANVQFEDALVSSAVVWIKNCPPPKDHRVKFTFGGSLMEPEVSKDISSVALSSERKWSRFPCSDERTQHSYIRLGDFFQIKRGIATGDNKFFILSRDEAAAKKIPGRFLRPILPSPRYLSTNEVKAKKCGAPDIDKNLVLLDCAIPEGEIRDSFPPLYEYLSSEKDRVSAGYLCSKRRFWYAQEQRSAPPLLCTYMGRFRKPTDRPFRFILNHSNATATNVYLMLYPKPEVEHLFKQDPSLLKRIWKALGELDPNKLIGEGRVYGGGLYKLEPKELARVDLSSVVDDFLITPHANQPLQTDRTPLRSVGC